MLIDYIYFDDRSYNHDKRIFTSNFLHDIKYNKNIDGLYAKYSDIDLSVIDKLDKREFTRLCVLATYIEQAFNNRGMAGPDWVYDKRLVLSEPNFFPNSSASVILHATQACINHNVFMNRSDFEVY
jgi:D-alanine-D-alanine ligase-like ATP-grasp enzyme